MPTKTTFVLIDDDSDDHDIFEMALDELNKPTQCLFFSDCESALAYFSQKLMNAPDYVFIDINLPRIQGAQCLEQLQQLRDFDHPTIVMYSSPIPEKWREDFKKIGVDKFIEKTGSLPALVAQIQQLM